MAGPDGEGPGVNLRRAREARGMGIKDIAQDLHLDPWIIEALEADDFEALGAPVFAKGHLRQYGALLGLATDDLMIAYYRVRGRHDAAPPPITSTMTRPEKNRKAVWAAVALAVLVIGVLAILLWFLSGESNGGAARVSDFDNAAPLIPEVESTPPPADPGPGTASDTQPDGESAPETASDTVPDAVVEQPGEDGQATAALAPMPGTGAPVVTEPAPSGEAVSLRLVFNGESWVEVYDRDGARLVYGMYGAGRSRTVSGMPPIEVYLGRSRDVSLAVNGRAYPIPAQSIRGNTARFVIEAGVR